MQAPELVRRQSLTVCTADGFVIFLAVRPRAPFIAAVWLLPFQHTPSLTTGSHLTCKGTGPSEGLKSWGSCPGGCCMLSNKPSTNICPALVKNLKHLLSLGSLS